MTFHAGRTVTRHADSVRHPKCPDLKSLSEILSLDLDHALGRLLPLESVVYSPFEPHCSSASVVAVVSDDSAICWCFTMTLRNRCFLPSSSRT